MQPTVKFKWLTYFLIYDYSEVTCQAILLIYLKLGP